MSFLYPRTVAISRSNVPTSPGISPYGGETEAQEAPIATGIPASIQLKSLTGKPEPGLPSDAARAAYWLIFIPLNALALGTVKTHDIVTDDLGERYDVIANYWDSLGYALSAEKLEP